MVPSALSLFLVCVLSTRNRSATRRVLLCLRMPFRLVQTVEARMLCETTMRRSTRVSRL
jgi:hypothetical protein